MERSFIKDSLFDGVRISRLRLVDPVALIPAAGCLSLLVSAVAVSKKKPLWNDEMLSLVLLQDGSFAHMMTAWSDTFNQAPPLYFMLGWLWDKMAGSSDLSLRIFGSLLICLALIVTWVGLRRSWGSLPAALGTVSVYCISSLILYHNTEVRMYSLFTAVCAIGFLVYQKMVEDDPVSPRILIYNVLAQASIVLTHLYGLFYSGALLLSLVIADWLLRRSFRVKAYCSFIVGWLFIIPFIPGMIIQSQNQAGWFNVIGFEEFLYYYMISMNALGYIAGVILLAVALFAAKLIFSRWGGADYKDTEYSVQGPTIIVGFAFLLVPFAAWLGTVLIKPMLAERYIIPTIAIGWSIAATFLLHRLFFLKQAPHSRGNIGRTIRWVAAAVLTIPAVLFPLRAAYYYPSSPMPGAKDPQYGYADLPIAMEAGHDFLPRIRYAKRPQRYFHIRDWSVAVRNRASVYAKGDYTHLAAVNRHYPFVQSIEGAEFLAEHRSFLVWDEPDQKWFEWRVLSNPAYRVTQLAEEQGSTGPLRLFLVRPSQVDDWELSQRNNGDLQGYLPPV